MKLYELLGKTRQEFDRQMKAAGHKRIGYGIEAIVYSDPNNPDRVIKVLLGKEDIVPNSERRAFSVFYNYCKANKNNPHIPKFFKSTRVDYNGQKILKIEVEKLKKLNRSQEDIIIDMAAAAGSNRSYNQLIKEVEAKVARWIKNGAHPNLINGGKIELAKLVNDRGQYELLYKTILDFEKLAKQNRLMPDVWNGESHNIMQRSDGTIVVIDPFAD